MTVASVFGRNLFFHKPIFLLQLGERLRPFTNSYTIIIISLIINCFCIDELNQRLDEAFIRGNDKLFI
jgi:hypothetical protein